MSLYLIVDPQFLPQKKVKKKSLEYRVLPPFGEVFSVFSLQKIVYGPEHFIADTWSFSEVSNSGDQKCCDLNILTFTQGHLMEYRQYLDIAFYGLDSG